MRGFVILRFAVVAMVVLATACTDRVDTRIQLVLPDGVSSSSFSRLDIRVYPAGVACDILGAALLGSCDGTCTADLTSSRVPFDERRDQATDRRDAVVMAGAPLESIEVPVGADGPWSVLVAIDRDGEEPLFGCAEVLASEAHTQVVLGWDWCDAAATSCDSCADALDTSCDGFHPACGVRRACDVALEGAVPAPRTDRTAPMCTPAMSTAVYYQDETTDCQDESETFAGSYCQPAIIDCSERLNLAGTVLQGECGDMEPTCLAIDEFRTADDRDCDGTLPPLCGRPEDCVEDTACNVQGCAGTIDCTLLTCVPTPLAGRNDACNGADDDCDGIFDEQGDDECAALPEADRCVGGSCRCGIGNPCAPGFTCCGDRSNAFCVDLQSNDDHCRACFMGCGGDLVCHMGECLSRDRVPFMVPG